MRGPGAGCAAAARRREASDAAARAVRDIPRGGDKLCLLRRDLWHVLRGDCAALRRRAQTVRVRGDSRGPLCHTVRAVNSVQLFLRGCCCCCEESEHSRRNACVFSRQSCCAPRTNDAKSKKNALMRLNLVARLLAHHCSGESKAHLCRARQRSPAHRSQRERTLALAQNGVLQAPVRPPLQSSAGGVAGAQVWWCVCVCVRGLLRESAAQADTLPSATQQTKQAAGSRSSPCTRTACPRSWRRRVRSSPRAPPQRRRHAARSHVNPNTHQPKTGKEGGKVLDEHLGKFTELAKAQAAQLKKDFQQELERAQQMERQRQQQSSTRR